MYADELMIILLSYFVFFSRKDDISKEAETGKIYRTDYLDRLGRAVLVMKPSSQVQNFDP